MNRSFALLSAAALFAATASAQCVTVTGASVTSLMTPTSSYPIDDEGRTSDILLPFTFDIGGVSWTHIAIESNGEVYLTNGTGVVNPANFGIASLADMRGGVGGSPRICAMGGDLEGATGWDIKLDDTVPGEVKITWEHVKPWGVAGPDWTTSVTLLAGGLVSLSYSAGNFGTPNTGDFAGVSAGNDAGSATTLSSNLNAGGDSGTEGLVYQNDWNPWDLDDQTILFAPNGTGGFSYFVTCGSPPNPPASHTNYGVGCYDIASESFYQDFADAVAASAALQGNAMLLVPTADGYNASWLAGAAAALYVPPTGGATNLAPGDDTSATYSPVASFPSPWGPVTDLTVHGNGIIAFGAVAIDSPGTTIWVPTAEGFLDSANGGVYSWHDYAENDGGDVFGEEIGGVTYVSYVDVEGWPLGVPTATPSTLQFQFDQTTGIITVVWLAVDIDTSSLDGTGHVIGWTPPGASLDPGPIDLATQLPVTTSPDSYALKLDATPAPISTPLSGTTVTYTVTDAPELFAGSGVSVGILILSAFNNPGVDLGFIGAPGCSAYVGSLDLTLSFVGLVGPQTVLLDIPPGVPYGIQLFAQAAALADGVNAFGMVTSNGVQSDISDN